MSGIVEDFYLANLAEAVSHFGDAVLTANIRPERIHAFASLLEGAQDGQTIVFRLQSHAGEDDEDSDTRTRVNTILAKAKWGALTDRASVAYAA